MSNIEDPEARGTMIFAWWMACLADAYRSVYYRRKPMLYVPCRIRQLGAVNYDITTLTLSSAGMTMTMTSTSTPSAQSPQT